MPWGGFLPNLIKMKVLENEKVFPNRKNRRKFMMKFNFKSDCFFNPSSNLYQNHNKALGDEKLIYSKTVSTIIFPIFF